MSIVYQILFNLCSRVYPYVRRSVHLSKPRWFVLNLNIPIAHESDMTEVKYKSYCMNGLVHLFVKRRGMSLSPPFPISLLVLADAEDCFRDLPQTHCLDFMGSPRPAADRRRRFLLLGSSSRPVYSFSL